MLGITAYKFKHAVYVAAINRGPFRRRSSHTVHFVGVTPYASVKIIINPDSGLDISLSQCPFPYLVIDSGSVIANVAVTC